MTDKITDQQLAQEGQNGVVEYKEKSETEQITDKTLGEVADIMGVVDRVEVSDKEKYIKITVWGREITVELALASEEISIEKEVELEDWEKYVKLSITGKDCKKIYAIKKGWEVIKKKDFKFKWCDIEEINWEFFVEWRILDKVYM